MASPGNEHFANCTGTRSFRVVLYKSLFTENSVATQKHSSANINTNKIQYNIQR